MFETGSEDSAPTPVPPSPEPAPTSDVEPQSSAPPEVTPATPNGTPPAPPPPLGEDPLVFKAMAYNAVTGAKDYDEAIQNLGTAFASDTWSDNDAAKAALSEYSSKAQARFGVTPEHFDPINEAPFPPSAFKSEKADPYAKARDIVTQWRDKNLEFLDETNDPTYLAVKQPLAQRIKRYANEAQKDLITGGDKGGLISHLEDIGLSLTSGAVDPIAELLTGEPTNISSHISRKNEGLLTKAAGFVGGIAPVVAASVVGGPIGGGAALTAQAAGSTRNLYDETLAQTGDTSKATKAALIEGGVQAVLIPFGSKLVSAPVSALLGKTVSEGADAAINQLVKNPAKELVKGAAEGAAITAAQTVGTNIAVQQGLNPDQRTFEGVGEEALLGGAIFGGLHAAGVVTENARLDAVARKLKALHEEETAPKTETEKQTSTAEGILADHAPDVGYANAEVKPEPIPTDVPEYKITGHSEDPLPSEANSKAQKDIYEETAQHWDEPVPESKPEDEPVYDVSKPEDVLGTDRAPTGNILAAAPEDIESHIDWNSTPGRMLMALGRALVGIDPVVLKRTLLGKLGYYKPKDGLVYLPRSIGADPMQFIKTFAHELGHMFQFKYEGPLTQSPLYNMIRNVSEGAKAVLDKSDVELMTDAIRASQEWRPGWNNNASPGYLKYRANPFEIHADVFSYLMANPEEFKTKYSRLYNAMDSGLARDAQIGPFWSELKAFWKDPQRLQDYMFQQKGEERAQPGIIEAKAREQAMAERPTVKENIAYLLKSPVTALFRQDVNLKKMIRDLPKATQNELWKALNNIGAPAAKADALKSQLNRNVSKWVESVNNFAKESKLEKKQIFNEIDERLKNNKILNETTETIETLKKEIGTLAPVVEKLADHLTAKFPKYAEKLRTAARNHDVNEVTDLLARLQLELNSKLPEVTPKQRAKLDKITDPEIRAREEAALKEERSLRMENRENPYYKALKESVAGEADPATRGIMQKLIDPKSFNVRKYLLNPQGETYFDAQASDVAQKNRLGDANYQKVKDLADNFYKVNKPSLDVMLNSKVLGDDLKTRIKLNKDAYTTTLILKYFEGDDSISGGFRQAIGTLNPSGSESAATILKMYAAATHIFQQEKKNGLVDFAEKAGKNPEKVKLKRGDSPYDEQHVYAAKDKENSYIVKVSDGVPSLWKLPGTEWKIFTQSPSWGKWADIGGSIIQDMRNLLLTRELKTTLSPSFSLGLRFRNTQTEAIALNSKAPTLFGLMHLPGTVGYKLRKEVKADIEHYLLTGAPKEGGYLETALPGGVLPGYLYYHGDSDYGQQGLADAIYRGYGAEMPPQIVSRTAKINRQFNEVARHLGFRVFEDAAFNQEFRGKLMGYAIGKHKGMSDEQAAVYARQNFGTPDSYGGGTYGATFNKFFLFGKTHLNEIAATSALLSDLAPKDATYQFVFRVALPKMLTNKVTGVAIAGALWGGAAAGQYKKWLDYVPGQDFVTKNVIPIGWVSPDGHRYMLGEVPTEKIGPDWKAWYARIPQSKAVTDVGMLMWDPLQDILGGQFSKAVADSIKGAKEEFGSLPDPALQYGWNILKTMGGGTPMDYFRNKPLLSKDEVQGGSFFGKLAQVTGKSLLREVPTILPSNFFNESEGLVQSLSRGETPALKDIPIAGGIVRSLTGEQNYGLAEKTQEGRDMLQNVQSELRLDMDSNTQHLQKEYGRLQAMVNENGGVKSLSPNDKNNYHLLRSWREKAYKGAFNELTNAYQKGDSSAMDHWYKEINRQSASIAPLVKEPSKVSQ